MYNTKNFYLQMKKQIFILSLLLFFGISLYAQPKAVGEPKVIAKMNEPLQRPVWSIDGAKLFLTSSDGLWEVSNNGSNLRKTSVDASQLRITTNTNQLLQQMISDPMKVASKVEALKSLSGSIIFNPVLSPQGDKIVFQAGNGLYICDADPQAGASSLRKFDQGTRASWTPDGKYLVAMVEGNDGHFITKGELITIDVATGTKNVLLSSDKYIAFSPAVSPDGTKVAFEEYASGAIYVMDIQY
jgi:Tol biopolymer transport system component